MRIVHDLVLSLAVVLISIDLSAQFECLPNGEPIPGVPRYESSSSPPARTSPERTHPLVRPDYPPLGGRIRSSPARPRALRILGFKLEQLRFIRLIPYKNPQRYFEIQRYTFPAEKRIQLRRNGIFDFIPVPNEEQTVLTTSTGDVVAIFEKNRLRGIYKKNVSCKRVKINIHKGEIEVITSEDVLESPVGKHQPIRKNYKIVNLQDVPPKH